MKRRLFGTTRRTLALSVVGFALVAGAAYASIPGADGGWHWAWMSFSPEILACPSQ